MVKIKIIADQEFLKYFSSNKISKVLTEDVAKLKNHKEIVKTISGVNLLFIVTDEVGAWKISRVANLQKVDLILVILRERPNNAMNPGNAAPLKISADELYKIHLQRGAHILTVAAHHQADILILGAFGCGAFRNNPKIVAEAYKEALKKFSGYFQEVVFAVYCSPKNGNENYIAFNQILKES